MAVEILAAGTGSANSSTVTVTAAAPVTVWLKHSSGTIPDWTSAVPTGTVPRGVFVSRQNADASFQVTGESLTPERPWLVLSAPGVYRLRRLAILSGEAIGIDRSDP